MKTTLPGVARRTRFELHAQPLSTAVFERALTPQERDALAETVFDFYSKSPGGPSRPMINVEFLDEGIVQFRKVHGRELPTKQLFDRLLGLLADELSFIDGPECESIPDRLIPTAIERPLYIDHTTSGPSGFVPRSKWSRRSV